MLVLCFREDFNALALLYAASDNIYLTVSFLDMRDLLLWDNDTPCHQIGTRKAVVRD